MPHQGIAASSRARSSGDASTLDERLELLERHDREVQASIDRLIEQQTHLREKIAWYRGQVGGQA